MVNYGVLQRWDTVWVITSPFMYHTCSLRFLVPPRKSECSKVRGFMSPKVLFSEGS